MLWRVYSAGEGHACKEVAYREHLRAKPELLGAGKMDKLIIAELEINLRATTKS